jgi:hypothetical protein
MLLHNKTHKFKTKCHHLSSNTKQWLQKAYLEYSYSVLNPSNRICIIKQFKIFSNSPFSSLSITFPRSPVTWHFTIFFIIHLLHHRDIYVNKSMLIESMNNSEFVFASTCHSAQESSRILSRKLFLERLCNFLVTKYCWIILVNLLFYFKLDNFCFSFFSLIFNHWH